MKKIRFLSVAALAAAGMLSVTACNGGNNYGDIKLGLILLHPHEDSTYDKNFYEGVESAANELGFKWVFRENIPENDPQCTTTADGLADDGCNIIFADSFGHESPLLESAKKHPNVTYLHATGNQAATCGYSNFFDAFASIYEGRYLTGVAAGWKLKAMMDADPTVSPHIGYVGAYTYSEVRSGLTSFYLGVKSVVPTVTMDVRYTGSWYDPTEEAAAANALINTDHCVLLSQHADSYGAPNACEAAGVPNVSYNYSTERQGPNTYLIASKIDWSVFVKEAVKAVAEKRPVQQDFVGTLSNGGVKVFDCSSNCPAGTQEKVNEAANKLKNGTLKVFDTNTFTVGGSKLTTRKITVAGQERETIVDGEFKESYFASAPYIDFLIDGITEKNQKF